MDIQDSRRRLAAKPPRCNGGKTPQAEPALQPMNETEALLLQDARWKFQRVLGQWACDVLVLRRRGADGLRWIGAAPEDWQRRDEPDSIAA